MNANRIFDVEQVGLTVIVTPRRDPDELTFDEHVDSETERVFNQLDTGKAKNVVVDCHRIERCSSSAVAFFVRLAKEVRGMDGRMAFCNVSAHLLEVFKMLNLDTLWLICGSRDEAIAKVESPLAD